MIQNMDSLTVTQFFEKGPKDIPNTIDGYDGNVFFSSQNLVLILVSTRLGGRYVRGLVPNVRLATMTLLHKVG